MPEVRQLVRASIIASIQSVESHFKQSIPTIMGPMGLGCEGLESDRIGISELVVRFEQYFEKNFFLAGSVI